MVVLSGMTAQPRSRQRRAAAVATDDGYSVQLIRVVQTNDFDDAAPLDEQMDEHERRRLLYVAATRARDHLVVSLHRPAADRRPPAELLADAGGADGAGRQRSSSRPTAAAARRARRPTPRHRPRPTATAWRRSRAARASQRTRPPSAPPAWRAPSPRSCSLPTEAEPGARQGPARPRAAALVEGPLRHRDRPRRARRAAGRRPRPTGAGLDDAVAAQCVAEGIPGSATLVAALVALGARAPTSSSAPPRASTGARPTSAPSQDDGTVLEGFVDLVYRDDDGSWSSSTTRPTRSPRRPCPAGSPTTPPSCRPTGDASRTQLGPRSSSMLLFLHPEAEAVEARVPG